ncbi:hypothetical protein DFJ63DRAFT_144474 [Scheffersomyces coipomensis]|uniref:uncharacterized protein n=1 Tax=Scheffersomyces coipomensis TaxID=1788519 RepID=UPI00315C5A05
MSDDKTDEKTIKKIGLFSTKNPIIRSIVIVSLITILITKYDLINYLMDPSIWKHYSSTASENPITNHIFSEFQSDPNERFHIHDTFKYGWIAIVSFIIIMSLSMVL